jgi:hypothetical protein
MEWVSFTSLEGVSQVGPMLIAPCPDPFLEDLNYDKGHHHGHHDEDHNGALPGPFCPKVSPTAFASLLNPLLDDSGGQAACQGLHWVHHAGWARLANVSAFC